MKATSKRWASWAVGLALGGTSLLATAAPLSPSSVAFSAQRFVVTPGAVGETLFAPFTAGGINFSVISEVDQYIQTGASTFDETGIARMSPFLRTIGGVGLPAGNTGLNLSSTSLGYSLYALFSGKGTTTTTPTGLISGQFSTFSITFYVDPNNDTIMDGDVDPDDPNPPPPKPTGPDDPGRGFTMSRISGFSDDVSVLTGSLLVGTFSAAASLAAGDFHVLFQVTGFGDRPGFFPSTLTSGDINGVNSSISNANPDAIILGSGNTSYGTLVFISDVPEPGSLALAGLALVALGLTRGRARSRRIAD